MFVWLGKVLAFSQLTALPPKAQPKAKPSSTSEVYDSLSLLLIKLILLLLLYPLVMTYNCEIFMSDSMLFHLTETTDTVTSVWKSCIWCLSISVNSYAMAIPGCKGKIHILWLIYKWLQKVAVARWNCFGCWQITAVACSLGGRCHLVCKHLTAAS